MKASGLSVSQGAALTIGALLGTGVISLPALAAHAAGPASLLAWAGLVVLSVPLAVTFAALGSRHPDGGGVSTYVRLAFGERASAMVGWAFYLTIPLGAPVAAGFAADYVAHVVGGGRETTLCVVAAIIAVVVAMNWKGIRISGAVQLAIAGVIAALLLVATLVALPHAQAAHLTPFAPHGMGAIGGAAALLVWAFAGWEVVGSLSAEYADPRRAIPRATAIALVVVGILYLGIAFVTVAALGPAPGRAPLADLLAYGIGGAAGPVTAVIAVLLTIGAINAYFAGGSRMGAALARDGALPAWLARGAESGEVPRRSLTVMGVIAFGSIAALAIFQVPTSALLPFATGTFSLIYVFAALAALRLLRRWSTGWWCSVVTLLAGAGLLALTGRNAVAPIVFALLGLGWMLVAQRSRPAEWSAEAAEQPVTPREADAAAAPALEGSCS